MKKILLAQLCCIWVLTLAAGSVFAQPEGDVAGIVAELTEALSLSDEQAAQFGAAIEKYTATLDKLFEEQEAEDADPANLINGVKAAQAQFDTDITAFLSKDQVKQFNDMKEQAIKGMLTDLSAIQLMDAQAKTTITDEQVDELAPLMGNARYQIMQIAWENAGKKLRPAQKVGLARKLKSLQRDIRNGLEDILTPEQLQALDAYKAEQAG